MQFNGYNLQNVGAINVILGKNGCGKSTLLRSFESFKRGLGYSQYITPERGGQLTLDGGVETNLQDQNWLASIRGRNQSNQFRQTSVSQFRKLETLTLREIVSTPRIRQDPSVTFDLTINKINSLLDNVEIFTAANGSFKFRSKNEGGERQAESLSSGESELISLAIEILTYGQIARSPEYKDRDNWLVFDEPDVHLHPDLQARLMAFVVDVVAAGSVNVLLATHSTTVLDALSRKQDVRVAFMGRDQKSLTFESAGAELKAVLPIFGAHPLSNVFNESPILLVEGEDDERIWQTAVRSAVGGIRVWPCAATSIDLLNSFELKAKAIVEAVYENGRAFSLRDRDDNPYEIEDLGAVVRARLNCRAAENLLLTTEVLEILGTTWDDLRASLEEWLSEFPRHVHWTAMDTFRAGNWDRRNADLKNLRNLIVGQSGSTKPWEVAVGQGIARLKRNQPQADEYGLSSFLGPKIVDALNLRP